ncbi:MAG: hypothetical protein ACUVXG_08365 [Anaerolineae bacterium]
MAAVKRAGVVLLVVVSAVLAILVGKQVSPDAAALLLGVVAGFLASLPVAVLVALWVARRGRDEEARERERPSPPVVIVAPGSSMQRWQPGAPWSATAWGDGAPTAGRHFVQDDWEDEDSPL